MTKAYLRDALDNTAVVNRVTDTIVGVWDLKPTEEQAPESAVSYKYEAEGSESVVGTDERQKVSPADFAEGGKYRCKFYFKFLAIISQHRLLTYTMKERKKERKKEVLFLTEFQPS